jgi:hypothetical protein
MTDEKVKSLSDFLARVSQLRDEWRLEDKKELWFRGETSRYTTSLRPTLYRPKRKSPHSLEELPLKPIRELLEIESDLYDEFKREAVQLCDAQATKDDWDWDAYFLMQHHGAPTRLLDWSDGALLSLHFALRDKEDGDATDAVVYVLEPYRLMDKLEALPDRATLVKAWEEHVEKNPDYSLNRNDWDSSYLPSEESLQIPGPPLLLDFPHITRRVAAQRSRFMVFGKDHNWLSAETEKADSTIKRLIIDANCVSRMRRDLRDAGVTESVIFPDLDGLGREMAQLWRERR